VIIGDLSDGTAAGGTTLSFAHTADAGNNRVVVAGVTFETTNAPTLTGATFNGIAMILARSDQSDSGSPGTQNPTYLYYINLGDSLSATTADVIFSLTAGPSSANTIIGGAVTLLDAAQTGPEAVNGNTANSAQGSISTTLTPVTSGAAVIDIVNNAAPNNTLTATSGQTIFANGGVLGSTGAMGYEILGAGVSETHAWSATTASRWSLSSASFAGAPVPEPATLSLVGLGGLALLARRRR